MQLFSIGLLTLLASGQPDLKRITRGFAIGLTLGTVAAAWYAFGWSFGDWHGIIPTFGKPAGLFYNSIIFGDACAITILLLLVYRDYWFIPALAFGLYLSDSRGAALALVVGVIAWIAQERKWALLLYALLAAPVALVAWRTGISDNMRLAVWTYIIHNPHWLGWGPGHLEEVAILWGSNRYIVEYAHNEFLDLFHSYGVGSLLFVCLLLGPVTQARRAEWPAYVAFLGACLWSFPLHWPPEAFLGAILAGGLYRGWTLPRLNLAGWGRALSLRPYSWKSLGGLGWRGGFPVRSRSLENGSCLNS